MLLFIPIQAEATVTINVGQINDVIPTCVASSNSVRMLETTGVGQQVDTIRYIFQPCYTIDSMNHHHGAFDKNTISYYEQFCNCNKPILM